MLEEKKPYTLYLDYLQENVRDYSQVWHILGQGRGLLQQFDGHFG